MTIRYRRDVLAGTALLLAGGEPIAFYYVSEAAARETPGVVDTVRDAF